MRGVPAGAPSLAVHYVRIGESPPDLLLDEGDRAYVAEAARASVALRRATSRSFARRALAHELELPERAIGIDRDRLGRPHLADRNEVEFSVSSTEALVAVAISDAGRIGLDIEPESRRDPPRGCWLPDYEPASRGRCGQRERHLRRWTLGEAYLKEAGLGLGVPARTLRVRVRMQPRSGDVEACQFSVAKPYVAALQACSPRGFASFRHAGHLWALVGRGRLSRGSISVHRWIAGAPRRAGEQRLSPCAPSTREPLGGRLGGRDGES